MKMIKIVCVIGCATIFFVGCASHRKNHHYFGDQTATYKDSQSVPALHMPADYSRAKIEEYYRIPPVSPGVNTSTSLVPPGSLLAKKKWQAHFRKHPRKR